MSLLRLLPSIYGEILSNVSRQNMQNKMECNADAMKH
jgi:hypothetical protein